MDLDGSIMKDDFKTITRPDEMSFLFKNILCIHAIIFTQDFERHVSKEDVMQIYYQSPNFIFIGEVKPSYIKIVLFAKSIYISCRNKEKETKRFTCYNNYMQSFASLAVRKNSGNRKAVFVSNPNPGLEETIDYGIERGMLISKITFF